MFMFTLFTIITLLCGYIVKLKKAIGSYKKLNAELHDRYSLLWTDYLRRGKRITLYESGLSKEEVDTLERRVQCNLSRKVTAERLSEVKVNL
ncbi:hypothetical protein [Phytobacter massiliensis]|uniref:hypothetical protein n=1 Tax=Phytobacter massiliensis TaxID=1485952 RepID=UPI0005C70B11|nr:hypothetical protein [Phytobacter massiliensis]